MFIQNCKTSNFRNSQLQGFTMVWHTVWNLNTWVLSRKATLCREQMMILVWVDEDNGLDWSEKLYYQSGLICLYAPLQYNFSKPHIGCQKCDNHLLVVAPGTLGMMPATSLGLVRQGWRKAYQRCHHGGLSTEQRGTTNWYNIAALISHHKSPYHRPQSHGITNHTWFHKMHFISLPLSVERRKNINIKVDNPYYICIHH